MNKVLNVIKNLWHKFVQNFIKMPLRILAHPVIGYTEFKEDKKGKLSVAIGMVLIYALITIIRYNADGIIINANDPTKFNSIKLLIYTIMLIRSIEYSNSVSGLHVTKTTFDKLTLLVGASGMGKTMI